MARTHDYDYFGVFVEMTEYSRKAAAIVDEVLQAFDPASLPTKLEEIHAIEQAADEKKHELMKALVREFLPPLEVEDIVELTHLLDDVTDSVEDILIKLYAYNIQRIRPEALHFSKLICTCCDTLKRMMEQFPHYKKGNVIESYVVEMNDLEGQGDDIYTQAMHDLHVSATDPIEILTWSRMLDCFEESCDVMESVANALENISMKNS